DALRFAWASGEPTNDTAPDLLVTRGGIEFQGVGFAYAETGSPVFTDLDVSIKPGESVAITGESGSGKSTL
ncbi:ATP-binding cassette domain-containing protein, partial [Klebsiella pneumoniae]|nr:ATP-binding cassette domain-containing protein [Klebsiella pneumoniae]